ncbi:MAG: hypothetical protein K1X72_17260 [Pyrinomonadaceae bacterium]|nr:hypothetical protein [Pyrinomonadaceae bacterium]
MKKDLLILKENNFGIRIGGIFVLLLGLLIIVASFLMDLAKLFGYNDFLSKIIMLAVAFIIGILLIFFSYFMMTMRDKEMIFDAVQQKMFYSDHNFFQKDRREHSFKEIVNFGQVHTSLENSDFYENYLHLANATGIEIPSNHKTNKELQDQQIQHIKDFIGM